MTNPSTGLRDLPLQHGETDSLGIDRYAMALASFIRECQTPMTVGIQGDWGSGKTSLMNLVEGQLAARPKVPCIKLNMWQYAQETHTSALSYIVLGALVRRLEPAEEPANKVGSFLKRAVTAVNLNKVEVAGIGFEFGDRKGDEQPTGIEDIKDLMASMVKARMAEAKADRLVIFVDDLDRILPRSAVQLLEVLKNFVDVPGCVFVLACDYQVVMKGLKERFGVDQDDLGGRSFFDKIIQVPFRMPVHRYDVNRYVGDILKQIDWPHAPEDLEQYTALLANSIGFNPRSLKRLGNTLLLIRKVAEMDTDAAIRRSLKEPSRLKVLFGLCCMEACYDTVFGEMSKVAESDTEALEALLLRPAKALSEGEWKSVAAVKGLDKTTAQLEEFLTQLGAVVDADKNGRIDESEAQIISEMLKLTRVTSVDASAARPREPNSTPEDLARIADEHGSRALVDQLLASLRGKLHERMTQTTFSFDARIRQNKRWRRLSCATLDPKAERPQHCRLGLNMNRLGKFAGSRDQYRQAFVALESFVQSRFADMRSTSSENYYNLVLGDEQIVAELCVLLDRLKDLQ